MTQTANNYGEVLFELGIKKDTVEESKRIFSLTEQLHRTLESPIISKNEKYSIIEKVFPKEIENFLKNIHIEYPIKKEATAIKVTNPVCFIIDIKGILTPKAYFITPK